MILLGVVALATLAANGARQLRYAALAFLVVSIIANTIASSATTPVEVAVSALAGLVASAILYVAARDSAYGEEPGWRLWLLATIVAAAATQAAFTSFRTVVGEGAQPPLFELDRSGVSAQVTAFWLLSSGVAILLTARSAVRMSVGALVMITGVQLLVKVAAGPDVVLTVMLSWLEVVVALAGAFLIVNERAVREA